MTKRYFEPIDIKGCHYGQLTALERIGLDEKGNALWDCICECGNHRTVAAAQLRKGDIKACKECAHKAQKNHSTPMKLDLTGRRFGKLLVLQRMSREKENHGGLWLCKCDCGKETQKYGSHLLHSGQTMCEDCAHKEGKKRLSEITRKLKKNRLYRIWYSMKTRCGKDGQRHMKFAYYRSYGGRGISVCEEWLSYDNFKKWAENSGYEEDKTIERIDVNGNYCPDNCTWVSMREQYFNRRDSVYILYKDRKVSLAKMVFDLGLDKSTIFNYLNSAMAEEIFITGTQPPAAQQPAARLPQK